MTTVYPGGTATEQFREVRAGFGSGYDPQRLMRPETLAAMVAWVLAAPPDAYVSEFSVLPTPAGTELPASSANSRLKWERRSSRNRELSELAGLADTQQVDIREKTFADEAIKQLDFLKTQHGFTGPEVNRGAGPGTVVRVTYHRGDLDIEASLVLWYMGEEYVATTQILDTPDGAARRTQIAQNTAHTGYQMRRALRLQAEAVRATIRLSGQIRTHQRRDAWQFPEPAAERRDRYLQKS